MFKWFRKKKKRKKFVPTSKKLTWLISWTWVATIAAYFIVLFFSGHDATTVVVSVAGTYGVVLSAYFVKSYKENNGKTIENDTNSYGDGKELIFGEDDLG